MRTLLDNQTKAVNKLHRMKVGALFMEAGTGKTATAYELIKTIDTDYILWITPFQTKQNLRTEIDLCGGFENIDIVGVESIQASDRIYLEVYNKIAESNNAVIVCDESIKIKNFEAKRTKRLIELSKMAQYKLILNGTPITRNLLDLWAQFEFLSPRILNMQMAEFKNTFCEYVTITKNLGYKSIKKEFIVKYHNVEHLYSLVEPYVFECDLKIDVTSQYHEMTYSLSEEEKSRYQLIKEKYLDDEKLLAMNNNIFLELTQKMQHDYCVTAEKFDLLKTIIDTNGIDNCIVFTKYVVSRDEVKKLYPNAMVLSYQSHSFGLNLQERNVIIYFDKTFDYSQRIQSSHRIYRTGQQRDCVYYDLTGDVGLEKMINENITKKTTLLQYFKEVGAKQIKKEL